MTQENNTVMAPENVIEVENLKKYFPIRRGLLRREVGYVRAVDGVSFNVRKGETLGLVGESGCGKTTTARMILRAIDPTEGSIRFRMPDGVVDLAKLERHELKHIRKYIQMIFQDPYSSLNPRLPVLDIVAEPLYAHGVSRKDAESRVMELLEVVGLDPRYVRRYPHAFSGGQRQRIGIARALALNPSVVVADEAVSALDVSVQAQILNLLQDLQQQLNLTYIFIAHDLSVVRYICDRVAVMYVGRLVELAPVEDLFTNPKHPYTSALMAAVPDANPKQIWPKGIVSGEIPDTASEIKGCAFAARCQYAKDICRRERPELRKLDEAGTRTVACHFADELELEGVEASLPQTG